MTEVMAVKKYSVLKSSGVFEGLRSDGKFFTQQPSTMLGIRTRNIVYFWVMDLEEAAAERGRLLDNCMSGPHYAEGGGS